MTKPSYRMLKWTFFAAMAASLGTACVVSSGDGDDTDIEDGGSSGKTSSTAGKSGGGTGGNAGSAGSGGTGAGTGGSAGSSEGGSGEPTGGTPAAYEAGLCEDELGTMTPSELPSCDPTDASDADPCFKCTKANCCDEWQVCYGSNPTTACGWGPSAADDQGQFDCIQQCFTAAYDGIQDQDDLLAECEGTCLNQCEADGFATMGTQALITCTRTACLDECYPAPPVE